MQHRDHGFNGDNGTTSFVSASRVGSVARSVFRSVKESSGTRQRSFRVAGSWTQPCRSPFSLLTTTVFTLPARSTGSYNACTINGKKMLRRYEKKRTVIVLRADNPAISPVVVTAYDEFQVHGVVLEIVSRKVR